MKKRALVIISLLVLAGCNRGEGNIADEAVRSYEKLESSSGEESWQDEDPFALSVNYFSPGDSGEGEFPVAESDEPMEVTDRGPEGMLPGENRRPVIYGTFSQPVVPLSRLGAVLTEYPDMSILPPVKGVYRWYGSRLLSFEPAEPLLTEQEYRVSFKKGLPSLGGKKLKEDVSFSFRTEELEIASFYPGTPEEPWQGEMDEIPPETARHITVCFNHPVEREVLTPYLKVTSRLGEHSFKASRPEGEDLPPSFVDRTLVLTLDKLPETGDEVYLTLPPGARSREGAYGLSGEISRSFSTLSPFRYREWDDYSWRFPREGEADVRPVYLEFSHPLDGESVLDNLSVSLDMADLPSHVMVWDKYVRLNNLPAEYDSSYEIILGEGLKDIYGRSLGGEERITVETGPATSYYYIPQGGFRFLEAQFDPRFVFEYQNLKGGKWGIRSTDDPYTPLTKGQLNQDFDLSGQVRNRREFEMIDLSPFLNGDGRGAVAMGWMLEEEDSRWSPYKNDLVLQVTDLGVTVRYAYNRVLVWVNSLTDGRPAAGATVNLLYDNRFVAEGETDGEGLAVFTLEEGDFVRKFYDRDGRSHFRTEVVSGSDRAVFEPNGSHSPYQFGLWNQYSINRVEAPRPFTFLFCDRGLYKPGETVTFKGIDRDLALGRWEPYGGRYKITVRENKWRSKPVLTAQGSAGERGSFDGTLAVPEDLPPGDYLMEYTRLSGSGSGRVIRQIELKVENFRRAGFQVTVDAPLTEALPGEKASFPLTASYLSGGFLGGAPYRADWTREPITFTPGKPEYDGYVFGPRGWENDSYLGSTEGSLDSGGQAMLTRRLEEGDGSGRTYLYRVEARVEDPSRQEIAGRGFALVHPADFYIGARVKNSTDSWWTRFVAAGETSTAEFAFVTEKGEPFAAAGTPISLKLVRKEWKVARQRSVSGRISSNWEQEIIPVREETVSADGTGFTWDFIPDRAGFYVLEVTAPDGEGRTARTEIDLYASGSEWVKWQNRNPENIEMVTDRELYNPGDTARIMVQSPLEKGRYLLTIEREGILEERILDLEGSASVIDIPVKEEWCPVMYVSLTSWTARTEDPPSTYGVPDLGKPRGCYGLAILPVSTDVKVLDVTIEPEKSLYRPGEKGSCLITVSDGNGPVENGEVTFLAVDRGVLDLINYHVPDPVAYFYDRDNYAYGVHGGDSRSDLIDPVTYEVEELYGGDGPGEDKLNRRKDFSPLAVFEPGLITNGKGQVRVDFTFPDSLTTYRMTALVMEGDRFGRQEGEVPVQNPLTVRTSVPPVLRVRDTAFCGLFVTNLSGEPVTLTATAEMDESLVTLNGVSSREVTVKPGATEEIRYPLQALSPGEVTASFTVRSDLLSEVVEQKFIIEKPITGETFTITGELSPQGEETAAAQEGLVIPSNIARGYGSLDLTLASSRFANLDGAFDLFTDYPYDLTLDNKLIRVIPQLILGETLKVIRPDIYKEKALTRFYGEASAFQDREGGVGFIAGYMSRPSVWLSVRLLHFLTYPAARGEDMGSFDLNKLAEYVRRSCYSNEVSPALKLYGHYALSLLNGPAEESKAVAYLVDHEKDDLGLTGFLMAAMSLDLNTAQGRDTYKALAERIRNLTRVGTGTLDIIDTYESRSYFDSQIQDLALLTRFHSLYEDNRDLARLAAATLVSRQNYGRWERLNDTLWAFASLSEEILRTGEAETDLKVTLTAGETPLYATEFRGFSLTPQNWSGSLFADPLGSLPRDSLMPLTVEGEGTGTVYYTAGLTYGLPSEIATARDEGFSLYTVIEDLKGHPVEADKLKLGETYRMKAVLSSGKRRNMVALHIPVPSGAEILNASFETTGSYAGDGGVDDQNWTREDDYGADTTYDGEGYGRFIGDGFYFSAFPAEKRIGTNGVTYGFSDFYAGSREVSFLFRTACPGVFPVPPARAECLYEEEVFGRTGGALYVIR